MAWSKSHPGEGCLVEVPVAAPGLSHSTGAGAHRGLATAGPKKTLEKSFFLPGPAGVVGLGWAVGSVLGDPFLSQLWGLLLVT